MSNANIPAGVESVTADISMRIAGHQLKTKVTVPTARMGLKQLLPVVQQLSSSIVQIGEENVERQGLKISCQKGCGACCRQLVPIAPVETHGIRDLVEKMPEPRKTEILRRFAEAKEKMTAAGMWQKLTERANWPHDEVLQNGLDYFKLGVACPFLEDESCSIHLDRPMACREYLVTSPAANCANPTPEGVEWVPIPAKVWPVVARMEEAGAPQTYVPWTPLIQALDYAATHDEGPERPGPEWVSEVFSRLAKSSSVPAANMNPNIPAAG
ncbi:Flagellin N-methylase [Anatilimnocola aggregata]|uniref:Flagellin N-methylase n=1 Tax=Anatilimnocola aggregata TaxID=2528021 RepID=A0A517Y4W9_9BACT|nr:YkgJ family cysteine cluster protein [Anatilimnocola aggregata]QDU25277.1 Flagellin N-methylase [Anatilimnocola aggregata]